MKVRTVGESEVAAPPRRPRYTVPLTHPSFSVEACPRPECGYPEADGGFCPECGWTRGCSCAYCRRSRR